jgi:PAS domain S-box-containing protein
MASNIRSGSAVSTCQVVGIGASAGGLESLERFFRAVPATSGLAFVVIQHLSPDFRSVMDELIGRFTSMPVRRAEDGMEVEPDAVFLLPPGKEMIVADGRLRLTDKDPAQPLTLPIDHFFRSLASDCGSRAAAVVMSGSGTDGSRGVRDVHAAGGFVVAESEETAQFDGMPGSARRSGAVDLVLPPEKMPAELLRWARAATDRDEMPVKGVVLSVVDVTVLEEARRDLSRLSAIVQSTDDAIIGKSPAGVITSWNAGAEHLYGFTVEEAVGRHLSLCVPPDRLAETEDALNRVLRGERLAHYESVRVRKGGQLIDVSVRVSPVLDENGHVVGASSISRDITVRKQAERRQQAEHLVARLAAEATSLEEVAPRLADALRDCLGAELVEFHVTDTQGRLSPVGGARPAGQATAPLDTAWPEQARQRGRTVWFADVPPDGADATPRPAAAPPGFRSGLAFPVVRGEDCLSVLVFYWRDPLPPAPELRATVAAIGQTIGQLIRRGRAEGELRAAVTRRDRFLAMLSHELRNPLAAARTAVIALQRDHLDRPGRHAAYDVIARQVQHMSHLLDDLLDVARVTQDRLKLQPEGFDLSRAVTGAVEMAAPLAGERGVAMEVEGFAGPAMVVADLARITQMLGNLLANGVKYSPSGSAVRLVARCDGGEAVFRVVDHGVGMSRDVLDRAFDLFYQADDTLDRRQSGMGVGLTLARTIAALHGGTLTASSEGPGRGSMFEARLPLAQALVEEASPDVHAADGSYRIVLVEDHEDNREMIRLLLGCEGHLVEVAANGAEGLSLIERTRPDVALVDIGLPGIDGFTVAQRVRQNRALDEVGLIALSGYAQASDVEHARASGFDAHVAKPMSPEHLLAVVQAVIAERNGGRPSSMATEAPRHGVQEQSGTHE